MDIVFADSIRLNPDSGIPLVAQLTQQLTWLIASGELSVGENLPPIRALAADLGIHMHTVRAAYQRLEADRLVRMRPRVGTVVLDFDADFISGNQPDLISNLVGVLLPAAVPVYQQYIEGIQHALASTRWMPVICYTGDNPLTVERTIRQLITRQVEGYIVTSVGVTEEFKHSVPSESLPPVVFVDAPEAEQNSILSDAESAAYQATRHLLEHGYASVGLLTAPLEYENVVPCAEGYRRALQEFNRTYEPDLVFEGPDFHPESGKQIAKMILERERPPRALYIVADGLALGAMQGFQQAGVAVPEDIAIASYNDIEAASYANPALTTATFPGLDMGTRAVELLLDLMAGNHNRHDAIMLETELVIRQSCGCEAALG
ncbi:MAG: substrate-binding domain-containing protein [Anaerolineales bacterium]|jgi:LacI family transcriptional regulator